MSTPPSVAAGPESNRPASSPTAAAQADSKPIGRYSPVVSRRIEGTATIVSISGQVAVDEEGRVQCENDPGGQAEIVFARFLALLQRAGGDVSDIQSVSIFIADRAFFGAINKVRNRYFETHAPASTMLVAQLMEPGCLVEVNGLAIVTVPSAGDAA
jgi:2-iminobutanoate/2-iminopropanoate deaminase